MSTIFSFSFTTFPKDIGLEVSGILFTNTRVPYPCSYSRCNISMLYILLEDSILILGFHSSHFSTNSLTQISFLLSPIVWLMARLSQTRLFQINLVHRLYLSLPCLLSSNCQRGITFYLESAGEQFLYREVLHLCFL